jgi:hypothetical protein
MSFNYFIAYVSFMPNVGGFPWKFCFTILVYICKLFSVFPQIGWQLPTQ